MYTLSLFLSHSLARTVMVSYDAQALKADDIENLAIWIECFLANCWYFLLRIANRLRRKTQDKYLRKKERKYVAYELIQYDLDIYKFDVQPFECWLKLCIGKIRKNC